MTDDHRAMLYSAESLRVADAIARRIGRELKRDALEIARRDGRNIVSDGDIWEAFDRLDLGCIDRDL